MVCHPTVLLYGNETFDATRSEEVIVTKSEVEEKLLFVVFLIYTRSPVLLAV